MLSKHEQPLGLCNFYTWICAAKLHDSCICRQCSAVSTAPEGGYTQGVWVTDTTPPQMQLTSFDALSEDPRQMAIAEIILKQMPRSTICSFKNEGWLFWTMTMIYYYYIDRSPIGAMTLFSYSHTPGIILLRFPSQDSSVWQCGRVVIECFKLSEKALRKPSLSHCSWVSRAQCLPYLLDCAKKTSKSTVIFRDFIFRCKLEKSF